MGYGLVLIVMLASVIVQLRLKSKFKKYSKISNGAGLTGAEVAEKMLKDNGIYDVKVVSVQGTLTDHYNPTNKTLNLSRDVYSGRSVAAAAVAAHECGHAVQHACGYAPLRLRSAMVPVVSFAGNLVNLLIIGGIIVAYMFNGFPWVLILGIAMYALTTIFSFVTLPVEVNASSRAIEWLSMSRISDDRTTPMAVDCLKWAAYTYVVAALGSLATLLYYIGLARR